jgi:uncharacterized membrane protein YjjP (DUF1212 family)
MQPVELALDAALIVMQSGASTVAADRSFTDILKGCHQQDVAAVWRLDFIAATRAVEGRTSTILRPVGPVGPIGVNLVRASEMRVLAKRVAKGEVEVTAIGAEVQRIGQLPSPCNYWVIVLIAAFTAGCFSPIPGGDCGSLGIAFVAAGVGQLVRSLLRARKLAVAPVTLAAAPSCDTAEINRRLKRQVPRVRTTKIQRAPDRHDGVQPDSRPKRDTGHS